MASRYIHVDFAGTLSEALDYLAARPALDLLRVSRRKSPNGDCMIGRVVVSDSDEAKVCDQLCKLDPDEWTDEDIGRHNHKYRH